MCVSKTEHNEQVVKVETREYSDAYIVIHKIQKLFVSRMLK